MPNIAINNTAFTIHDSVSELNETVRTVKDIVDTTSEENMLFAQYCLSALELCSKCISDLAERVDALTHLD